MSFIPPGGVVGGFVPPGGGGGGGGPGPPGPPGPPNTLTIGTVTSGATPNVTITGASPNQVLNFVLPAAAPAVPVVTSGAISGTVGTAITLFQISATGSPTSYAITPALPANLTLNTTTGQITGIPAAALTATTFQITATNASGTSAPANLVITIAPAGVAPIVTAGAITAPVGVAIPTFQISATGSPTSYAITPALPANLSLNTTTGQITGIPAAVQAATTYQMTATNAFGTSAPANLVITISATAGPFNVSTTFGPGGIPTTFNSTTGRIPLNATNWPGWVPANDAVMNNDLYENTLFPTQNDLPVQLYAQFSGQAVGELRVTFDNFGTTTPGFGVTGSVNYWGYHAASHSVYIVGFNSTGNPVQVRLERV